jgi:TPP-dependent 2-oxoacid decarboxylase
MNAVIHKLPVYIELPVDMARVACRPPPPISRTLHQTSGKDSLDECVNSFLDDHMVLLAEPGDAFCAAPEFHIEEAEKDKLILIETRLPNRDCSEGLSRLGAAFRQSHHKILSQYPKKEGAQAPLMLATP